MNTLYNQIAGQSVERLPVLGDGIFAVVMTPMVLDLAHLEPSSFTATRSWGTRW